MDWERTGHTGGRPIIHEGPMADRRGTGWREAAAELEARAQERMENPMKTPPNRLTQIDKDHAARAKSDEGRLGPDVAEETGGAPRG
jgi:hypothetical protein